MKHLVIVAGIFTLAVATLVFLTRPVALPQGALPEHTVDIVNGEHIFHAGGCVSCHSSTEDETEHPVLGGGLEMETPFGIFRVPNISPHPANGIGGWSAMEFASAMHMGVSPTGRHYYPSFPYPSYHRMTLEDVLDLKAYLDTLPIAKNPNAEHTLKFPWNIRAGIGLWKIINLDSAAVIQVPENEKQLQRGRYLVEGPGHCGECHTPRNWSAGLDSAHWLAGAANPDGEGKVPNITSDKSGLAEWAQADIEYYLQSGFTPDFDTVGSSMVKVQENMARLTEADRAAIAAYLIYIPAQE